MRIDSLKIDHFRTLENIEVTLSGSYTAICGANDAGKTNLIRALRHLFRESAIEPRYFYDDDDDEEISMKDDYTKWSKVDQKDQRIEISATIAVSKDRDAGLHQFIAKQLPIDDPEDDLCLDVGVAYDQQEPEGNARIVFAGQDFSGAEADEVLNRIRTARCIQFHNSTENWRPSQMLGASIPQHDISTKDLARLEKAYGTLNNAFGQLAKSRQKAIEELLERIELSYRVGVSLPRFRPDYLPFRIALGELDYDIKLEDWGSGTRNQTYIMQRLIAARQISQSEASARKITPVIVIEEPESFLHPHAQARLGRVLQELSKDLDLQVIVTTHSPYLLSTKQPSANVLLQRRVFRRKARETKRVDTTGDRWMAPFAQALGFDSAVFEPWKELFAGSSEDLLLVEGNLDKEYLELLRDEAHGENRLRFDGDIVAYNGVGTLTNVVLLSLLKNRCRRMLVTFDLDSDKATSKALKDVGLERNKDFMSIGIDVAGKRNIEGLLPESVRFKVRREHSEWTDALESGTKEERESAKRSLKQGYLDEFKRSAKPKSDHYEEFYKLADGLNRCLAAKAK